MKTPRKRYSAEFEANVALEAIRSDLTLVELGTKHGIHHTMIAAWKRQAVEGMSATFSGVGELTKAATETDLERLHAKIGPVVVEQDFVAKAAGR
jgi:transposase